MNETNHPRSLTQAACTSERKGRKIGRRKGFARAVNIIDEHCGEAAKHAILDGKVKLTHRSIEYLANAININPGQHEAVGAALREHRVGQVRRYITELRRIERGDDGLPQIVRFKPTVPAAVDALIRYFGECECQEIIQSLQRSFQDNESLNMSSTGGSNGCK